MTKHDIKTRIDQARDGLRARGFLCLASGDIGLPSYTNIEAWSAGKVLVYLIYDRNTGGWDILHQIDDTNTINNTWLELEKLTQKQYDT